MVFDFDDCYWHDSILESIYIDRRDPGHNDTIELVVEWYEDKSRSRIVFSDVRLLKATLNFGIIAHETIDTAYLAPDDEALAAFYKGWKGLFDDVKLNCYVIETLSTGGNIKILARSVALYPLD